MKNRKRPVVLIPDEAGIIKAKRVPENMYSKPFTIGDMRELLFDMALRAENIAKDELAEVDSKYTDAMNLVIQTGQYLRMCIDDDELLKLPVHIIEKILSAGICAFMIGDFLELADVAPVLNKEQLLRKMFACTIANGKATVAGFATAAQDRAKKARAAAEKMETLQDTIEDRNRQRWEHWATVPDCIRAVFDMAKVEREDGKRIPLPGKYDTFRIKVSEYLKRNGKRRRGSDAKPYYQTEDIAEAVAKFYKAFDTKQYITEFSRIGKMSANVPDAKQKKAEHARQSRGLSEEQ